MSEAADKRIEELEKELRGTQEMLFLVLEAVGEPVLVSAERTRRGLGRDKMIDITLDEKVDQWVFSIKEVDSE